MAEEIQFAAECPVDVTQAGWGMRLIEKASNLFAVCCDDTICYMNSAGLSLLGAKQLEDILNKPLIDFVHLDYKDFFSLGLDVLAEEEEFIPLKLVTVAGDELDAKLLITAVRIEDEERFVVEVLDITQIKRASEAVRDREHRLTSILNTVAEGIVTFNEAGLIQSFNPAAEKIFGRHVRDVKNQHFDILLPPDNRESSRRFFEGHITPVDSKLLGKPIEVSGFNENVGEFPLELTVNRLQVANEFLYTVVLRDITERKQSEERIRHLAHHDSLTGLPNRHLFEDRLDHALRASKRYKKVLVLMFVDLDKFKPINDRLGHEAGDVVLKEVALRFKNLVRDSDTVARIGGDEFVILLEELDTPEPGLRVAEKILSALKEPIEAAGEECYVGASIGLSRYPIDAEQADLLMRYADEAMYAVKAAGRNDYRVYEPGLSVLGKSQ